MRKTTRKILFLIFALLGSLPGSAQWCNVNSALPYSAEMPGITNVTLNTINRNSLAIENYPNNSYVNTGVSTTLVAGQAYNVSITHTRDAVFFPTARNNIRIWIDYNHDYSFDDPGETVVSLNYETYGTSTAMFTVPTSIVAGTTRMRITAKMSDDAGHSIPTPCDIPADPIGYHGEIEDYDVILTSSVGINQTASPLNNFTLYPNPASSDVTLSFDLEKTSTMSLDIYDPVGKRIYAVPPVTKVPGNHVLTLKLSDMNITEGGIYFIEMNADNKKIIQKFVVK